MNVLIPVLRALSTPHYETDLEIAQRHLDRGDSVHFLVCNSSIPACDYAGHHNAASCLKCIERRDDGIDKLTPSPTTHEVLNLTERDKSILRGLPKSFESQKELRAFSVEEFDVGMAVLSTLFSKTRKLRLDVSGSLSQLVRDMIHTGVGIYLSTRNHLRELSPDRVYVFNGRFNTVRAVLRACQETQVDCYTHDRGHDLDHFEIYENTLPHDLSHIREKIDRYWQRADSDVRRTEGERFYEQRAEGYIPNWQSYTEDQEEGALPEGLNREKHNIAVYPSSEDEFAAIGQEWSNPVYSDQLSGLKKIISDLEEDKEVHLYVRIHPNLEGVDNVQTRGLLELEDRTRVTVIPADSAVSSYALLHASDCVLTFGSTMGIEATYWRKPSVLAGTCFYRELGGTYKPESHKAVVALLKDRSLEPKPTEPALKYGHYQATKGMPFQYFEPDGLFGGTFKGERVERRNGLMDRVGVRLAKSGKLDPLWRLLSKFTYPSRVNNVIPD